MRLCWEKIKRDETQLELNLATATYNTKKSFYKYINNKRKVQETHTFTGYGGETK